MAENKIKLKENYLTNKALEKIGELSGHTDINAQVNANVDAMYQPSEQMLQLAKQRNELEKSFSSQAQYQSNRPDILMNMTKAKDMSGLFKSIRQLREDEYNEQKFNQQKALNTLDLEMKSLELDERSKALELQKEESKRKIGNEIGKELYEQNLNQRSEFLSRGLTDDYRAVDRTNWGAIKDTYYDYAQSIAESNKLGKWLVNNTLGNVQAKREGLNNQKLDFFSDRALTQDEGVLGNIGNLAESVGNELYTSLVGALPEIAPMAIGSGVGSIAARVAKFGQSMSKASKIAGLSTGFAGETYRKAVDLSTDAEKDQEAVKTQRALFGAYDTNMQDVKDRLPEAGIYTLGSLADVALLKGAAKPIIQAFKPNAFDALKSIGKGTEKTTRRNVARNVFDAVKTAGIGGLIEAPAEAVQTLMEENSKSNNLLIDVLSGKKSFSEYAEKSREHSKKVKDAAIVGGIVGTAVGGAGSPITVTTNTIKDGIKDKQAKSALQEIQKYVDETTGKIKPEITKTPEYLSKVAIIANSKNVGTENDKLREQLNKDLKLINNLNDGKLVGTIIDESGNFIDEDKKDIATGLFKDNSGLFKGFQDTIMSLSKDVTNSVDYNKALVDLEASSGLDQINKLQGYLKGNVFEIVAAYKLLSDASNNFVKQSIKDLNIDKELTALGDVAKNAPTALEKQHALNARKELMKKIKEISSALGEIVENKKLHPQHLPTLFNSQLLKPLGDIANVIKDNPEVELKAKLYKDIDGAKDVSAITAQHTAIKTAQTQIDNLSGLTSGSILKDTNKVSVGGENIGTGVVDIDTANNIFATVNNGEWTIKKTNLADAMAEYNQLQDSKSKETAKKEIVQLAKAHLAAINQAEIENKGKLHSAVTNSGIASLIQTVNGMAEGKDKKELVDLILDMLSGPNGQTILNELDNVTFNVKDNKVSGSEAPKISAYEDDITKFLNYLQGYLGDSKDARAINIKLSSALRSVRKNNTTNFATVVAEQLDEWTKKMNLLYQVVGHKENYSKKTFDNYIINIAQDLSKTLDILKTKIRVHEVAIANLKSVKDTDRSKIESITDGKQVAYYKFNMDNPNSFTFINASENMTAEQVDKLNKNSYNSRMVYGYVGFDETTKEPNEIQTGKDSFIKILNDQIDAFNKMSEEFKALSDVSLKRFVESKTLPNKEYKFKSVKEAVTALHDLKTKINDGKALIKTLEAKAKNNSFTVEDSKKLAEAKDTLEKNIREFDSIKQAINTENSGLDAKQLKAIHTYLDLDRTVSEIRRNIIQFKRMIKTNRVGDALVNVALAIYRSIEALSKLFAELGPHHMKALGLDKYQNMLNVFKKEYSLGKTSIASMRKLLGDKKERRKLSKALSIVNRGISELSKRHQLPDMYNSYLQSNSKFADVIKDYLVSPQRSTDLLSQIEIQAERNNVPEDISNLFDSITDDNFKQIKEEFYKSIDTSLANLNVNPKDIAFTDMFEAEAVDTKTGKPKSVGKLKDYYKDILFLAFINTKSKITSLNIEKSKRPHTEMVGKEGMENPVTNFEALLGNSILELMGAVVTDDIAKAKADNLAASLGKSMNDIFKLNIITTANNANSMAAEADMYRKANHILETKGMVRSNNAFTFSARESITKSKYSTGSFKGIKVKINNIAQQALDRIASQGYGVNTATLQGLVNAFENGMLNKYIEATFINKTLGSRSKEFIKPLNTMAVDKVINRARDLLGDKADDFINEFYDVTGIDNSKVAEDISNIDNAQLVSEEYALSDRIANEVNDYLDIYYIDKLAKEKGVDEIYPIMSTQELYRMQVEGSVGNIQNNKKLRASLGYFVNNQMSKKAANAMDKRLNKSKNLAELTILTVLDKAAPGRMTVEQRTQLLQDSKARGILDTFKDILTDNKTYPTVADKALAFVVETGLNENNDINMASVLSLFNHITYDANVDKYNVDSKHLVVETDGSSFGYTSISALLGLSVEHLENASRGNISNQTISKLAHLDNYEMHGVMFIVDALDVSTDNSTQLLSTIPSTGLTYVELYNKLIGLAKEKWGIDSHTAKFMEYQLNILFKDKRTKKEAIPNLTAKDTYVDVLAREFKNGARYIGKSPVTLYVYGSGLDTNAGKMGIMQLNDVIRETMWEAKDTKLALGKLFSESSYSSTLKQLFEHIHNYNDFSAYILETELDEKLGLTPDTYTIGDLYNQMYLMNHILGINSQTEYKEFIAGDKAAQHTAEAIENMGKTLNKILEATLQRQSGYNTEYFDAMKKVHSMKNYVLLRRVVDKALDKAFPNGKVKSVDEYIKPASGRTDGFEVDFSDFSINDIQEAYLDVIKEIASNEKEQKLFNISSAKDMSALTSMLNHMVSQIKVKAPLEGQLPEQAKQHATLSVSDAENIGKEANKTSPNKVIFVEYGSTFAPSIGQRIDSSMMQMTFANVPLSYRGNQVFDAIITALPYIEEFDKAANHSLVSILYNLDMNPYYQSMVGAYNSIDSLIAHDKSIVSFLYDENTIKDTKVALGSIINMLEYTKRGQIEDIDNQSVKAFDLGLTFDEKVSDSISFTTKDVITDTLKKQTIQDYNRYSNNISKINAIALALGYNLVSLHNHNTFLRFIKDLTELQNIFTDVKQSLSGDIKKLIEAKYGKNLKVIEKNYNNSENFVDNINEFLSSYENIRFIEAITEAFTTVTTPTTDSNIDVGKDSPIHNHMSYYSVAKRQVKTYLTNLHLPAHIAEHSALAELLAIFQANKLRELSTNPNIVYDDKIATHDLVLTQDIGEITKNSVDTDGFKTAVISIYKPIITGEASEENVLDTLKNILGLQEDDNPKSLDNLRLDFYEDLIRALDLNYKNRNKPSSDTTPNKKDTYLISELDDETFVRLAMLLDSQKDVIGNSIFNVISNMGLGTETKNLVVDKLKYLGYDIDYTKADEVLEALSEIANDVRTHTPFSDEVASVATNSYMPNENPDIKLNKINRNDFFGTTSLDIAAAAISGSEAGTVNLDEDTSINVDKLIKATPEQLDNMLDDIIRNTSNPNIYRYQDSRWMKERMKEFIVHFSKDVNVVINTGINANTQGTYNSNTHTVTLHLTDKTRNRMSPAEIYLHELTHAFIDYAAKSKDPIIRRNYREIQRIQKEFIEYAKVNSKELADALGVDMPTFRRDYLEYMANSTEEFAAIMNSNSVLHEHLAKVNRQQNLWEKFKKLLSGILNIIFQTNMYLATTNEAANFDALMRKIGNANANLNTAHTGYKLEKLIIKSLEKANLTANAMLKKPKDNYANYAHKLVDKALKSNSKGMKAFALAIGMPVGMSSDSNMNSKVINLARQMGKDSNGWERFVSTIVAPDKGKQTLTNFYIGKSNDIDKIRNTIEATTKNQLKSAFNYDIPFEQQQALTRLIKATDITSLSNDTNVLINSYLTGNTKAYTDEYDDLATKLSAVVNNKETFEFMIRSIENQAEYMTTGKINGYLLSNATNIALRLTPTTEEFNSNEIKYDIGVAVSYIDRMISLKALLKTSPEDFKTARSLIETDRDGLAFMLDRIREITDSAKKEFTETTTKDGKIIYGVSNYLKGYVNRPTDKSISVRIGKASDEKAMRDLGYRMVDRYGSLNKTSIYGDVAIYVSHREYPQSYNRGIIRLTGENTRGWTVGNFIKQTNPDLSEERLEALTQAEMRALGLVLSSNKDNGWNTAKFIPMFNSKGKVVDYNLSLDNETKARLGIDEVSIFDTVASELSRTVDQQLTYLHNIDFIRANEQYYQANKDDKNLKFITIGAKGPELDTSYDREELIEMWNMIHPRVQQEVIDKFGGKIHIRSDLLQDIIGFKDMRLIKDDTEKNKVLTNNTVRRLLRRMEGAAMKTAKLNKERLILKNPDIMLGNLKSNLYMATLHGMPPSTIPTQLLKHMEIMLEYKADKDDIANLKAQIVLHPAKASKLQQKINDIEAKWEGTAIRDIDNYGLLTDIVEDTSFETEGQSDDFYDKEVNKVMVKLPPVLQQGVNTLMITQKTPLWKALNQLVGFSDSLFRLAVYEYKRESGMSQDEALELVERTFVNYSYHDIPTVKWVNDMGFMMFTKYLTRAQRTIIKDMFGSNPVTTAATMGMMFVSKSVLETPMLSFLPRKLERVTSMIHAPIYSFLHDYFTSDIIYADNFIPGLSKI